MFHPSPSDQKSGLVSSKKFHASFTTTSIPIPQGLALAFFDQSQELASSKGFWHRLFHLFFRTSALHKVIISARFISVNQFELILISLTTNSKSFHAAV
jgi:hypothetical protein